MLSESPYTLIAAEKEETEPEEGKIYPSECKFKKSKEDKKAL